MTDRPKRQRIAALLLATALIAGACGSDSGSSGGSSDGSTSATSSPTTEPSSQRETSSSTSVVTTTASTGSSVATTALEWECGDTWGPWDENPQLTWIESGRLMTTSPDGPSCIGQAQGTQLRWGPHGDRLLMDRQVLSQEGTMGVDLPDEATQVEWTRPTGLRMLFSNSAGALTKMELDGTTNAVDLHEFPISAFAYHPDGLHIVLATSFGATLARNDGSNPATLLQAGDEVDIPQIEFSANGTHLWFVAHHGEDRHLHIVDLEEESRPPDPELDAVLVPLGEDHRTLVDDIDLAGFVLDPRIPGLAAVSFGECGEAYTRIVTDEGEFGAAIEGSAVGFITADGQTALATSKGCESRTLILNQFEATLDEDPLGEPIQQVTITEAATAADIRDRLPDATFSLQGITLSGFT